MTSIYSVVCAALAALGLIAQQNPPAAASAAIADLPPIRGVYYHSPSGWVQLQSTLFMPYGISGGAASFFSVGHGHAVAEMPGPHADIQIGNDARPTFYLRGISPSDLFLVRFIAKPDYRELKMPLSGDFQEWAHFRAQDVSLLDLAGLAPDVIAIRPHADLKPGEYTLASVAEPRTLWIRIGYDFGLTASAR